MPRIYITRLKHDTKLLAANWDLEAAEREASTMIANSQGEATLEDFEYIPMHLPEKENTEEIPENKADPVTITLAGSVVSYRTSGGRNG